jgi:hypothetical protein
LVDYPFALENGLAWPSMEQSMAVGSGLHLAASAGFHRMHRPGDSFWRTFALETGYQGIQIALQLSDGWMHEEWHRAVMQRRQIDSFNNMYRMDVVFSGRGIVDVDQVPGEDLVRLKAQHPAEMVRMSMAGLESQHMMNEEFQRISFYSDLPGKSWGPLWNADLWLGTAMWMSWLNHSGYFTACEEGSFEGLMQVLAEEETDPLERDFTGPDCTAWVYDLHRPYEPYEERGVHPSGNGYDRYISLGEMSPAEREYLGRQRRLHRLGLANPQMFGVDAFLIGDGRFNVALGHSLTPFGYSIDVEAKALHRGRKFGLAVRNGFSASRYAPTVELDIYGMELPWQGASADVELMVWSQPADLLFAAERNRLGGQLQVGLYKGLYPWLDLALSLLAKTPGYAPGNVYLDPVAGGTAGLRFWPRLD